MKIVRCDVGGDYIHDGERMSYRQPCSQMVTTQYRGPGFAPGHWSHRCEQHAKWLSVAGITIKPYVPEA